MESDNRERDRTDEGQEIANRSQHERVSEADELSAAAKKQLLAMAGLTEEEAQEELSPVAEESISSETALKKELSPEEMEAVWFGEFKTRFDALPKLHEGVKWADVEKSLKADRESMAKLQALDEKGHAMNVFAEEHGEFIFVSAWDDFEKVSAEHRDITYDLEGQRSAEVKYDSKPNGNALNIIAKIMGVSEDDSYAPHQMRMALMIIPKKTGVRKVMANEYLAHPKYDERLRKVVNVKGSAWLKTNSRDRRESNRASVDNGRVQNPNMHDFCLSFRAQLKLKKA